jgi:hypothetical protein
MGETREISVAKRCILKGRISFNDFAQIRSSYFTEPQYDLAIQRLKTP